MRKHLSPCLGWAHKYARNTVNGEPCELHDIDTVINRRVEILAQLAENERQRQEARKLRLRTMATLSPKERELVERRLRERRSPPSTG